VAVATMLAQITTGAGRSLNSLNQSRGNRFARTAFAMDQDC
jgi:hypothetical protein